CTNFSFRISGPQTALYSHNSAFFVSAFPDGIAVTAGQAKGGTGVRTLDAHDLYQDSEVTHYMKRVPLVQLYEDTRLVQWVRAVLEKLQTGKVLLDRFKLREHQPLKLRAEPSKK